MDIKLELSNKIDQALTKINDVEGKIDIFLEKINKISISSNQGNSFSTVRKLYNNFFYFY